MNSRQLGGIRDALPGRIFEGSTGQISYHLAECIGEGGHGWVFRAHWDDPSGQPVVVKVLRPDAVNAEVLARFQREATVLRMLAMQGAPNPYVVRFFDHSIAQVHLSPTDTIALPFTVLEYVHGPTMEYVLGQEGTRGLGTARARRLIRHVCHALEHVHAQRVVHRDLKPSNILLARDAGTEIAKVTDFGLVKMVDVNLQRTATLAGASLGYAPPEQYERGNTRVSVRTDVFSLAAILFEMLAGRLAFPYRAGENPLLIVSRVLTAPRPSLVKLGVEIPAELRRFPDALAALDAELIRALDPEPDKRHASVADFMRAVDGPLQTMSVASVPPRAGQSPSQAPGQQGPYGPPQESGREGLAGSIAPPLDSGRVRFRTICDARPGESFRAAAIAPTALSAFAVGPAGAERLEEKYWRPVLLNPREDVARALSGQTRGVTVLACGDWLVYGEGFALRVGPDRAVRPLHMPLPDIVYHGASERADRVLLVGERRTPQGLSGFVGEYAGADVVAYADVRETARVNDAVGLEDNDWAVCGDDGTVARLSQGRVKDVRAVCRGHLLSIDCHTPRELLVVGTGGHALALNTSLEPRLEAVETTRDLRYVVATEGGSAWAASREGRVVLRSANAWKRVSFPGTDATRVLALWAQGPEVRVLLADGSMLAGSA